MSQKKQIREMNPTELKRKLEEKTVTLIDVREPHELDICKIDEAINIPMSEMESRWQEIPQKGDIVVMCRSGGRSSRVIEFLESKGYMNLVNLNGGILAWADEVDPSLEKY